MLEVCDDVVVEVLGEQQPRVARLEALWSERPVDNCERMLARCRLYYRPSVRPYCPPFIFPWLARDTRAPHARSEQGDLMVLLEVRLQTASL